MRDLVRRKDNTITIAHLNDNARFHQAELASFAIRKLKDNTYFLILPIPMDGCDDIDVDDKSSERVEGG